MLARLMGLKTISPERLQRLLRERGANVFDVNARASWLGARVPGARHLDPTGFGAADLPDDKGALLVFYCSNPLCAKAPSAARRAKKLGHDNVLVLSAGIRGWIGAGLPTQSGEAEASG